MPKPIPPPTVAACVPPDPERIYFEDCARFPFQPRARTLNLANTWWMAEASFAAYGSANPSGGVALDLAPVMRAGWSVQCAAEGNAQFLILENDDAAIVAFRGTRIDGFDIPLLNARGFAANLGDVATDAAFLLAPLEPGVLVHAGFLQAFRGIEQRLADCADAALAAGKALWFCGHSLGGALASLAAYRYRAKVQGLCTFGSPRVGDAEFVERLTAELSNLHRVVHHRDVVAAIPPEGAGFSWEWAERAGPRELGPALIARQYVHAGRLQFITGHRTWEVVEGAEASNSWRSLADAAAIHLREIGGILKNEFSVINPGTWPIWFDLIADHAPVYYANKLFNACEDAEAQRLG